MFAGKGPTLASSLKTILRPNMKNVNHQGFVCVSMQIKKALWARNVRLPSVCLLVLTTVELNHIWRHDSLGSGNLQLQSYPQKSAPHCIVISDTGSIAPQIRFLPSFSYFCLLTRFLLARLKVYTSPLVLTLFIFFWFYLQLISRIYLLVGFEYGRKVFRKDSFFAIYNDAPLISSCKN